MQHSRRLILALAIAISAMAVTVPQAGRADAPENDADAARAEARTADRLRAAVVNGDANDELVADAIRRVARAAGIAAVISRRARATLEDEPLSLPIGGMQADRALRLICDYARLSVINDRGVLRIYDRSENAVERTILHCYDVRDLIEPVREFGVTARMRLSGNEEHTGWISISDDFGDGDLYCRIDGASMIADLVAELTGGDSWSTNPDAVAIPLGGMLLVRQSVAVHLEIAGLLAEFRRYR
jgi:hypothetical protein